VIEPHPRALARRQGLAIDQHDIVGADIERRAFQHRAVHADAAFRDHRLAVAARGDAGTRHHLGDTLGLLRSSEASTVGVGVFTARPFEALFTTIALAEALAAKALATRRGAIAGRPAEAALAIGAGAERTFAALARRPAGAALALGAGTERTLGPAACARLGRLTASSR
jgi:hypothetical protein